MTNNQSPAERLEDVISMNGMRHNSLATEYHNGTFSDDELGDELWIEAIEQVNSEAKQAIITLIDELLVEAIGEQLTPIYSDDLPMAAVAQNLKKQHQRRKAIIKDLKND